jgi:hypothetical protein
MNRPRRGNGRPTHKDPHLPGVSPGCRRQGSVGKHHEPGCAPARLQRAWAAIRETAPQMFAARAMAVPGEAGPPAPSDARVPIRSRAVSALHTDSQPPANSVSPEPQLPDPRAPLGRRLVTNRLAIFTTAATGEGTRESRALALNVERTTRGPESAQGNPPTGQRGPVPTTTMMEGRGSSNDSSLAGVLGRVRRTGNLASPIYQGWLVRTSPRVYDTHVIVFTAPPPHVAQNHWDIHTTWWSARHRSCVGAKGRGTGAGVGRSCRTPYGL